MGVGVLTVPFAWGVAKIRAKDQLELAAREQIAHVFKRLHEDRLPHLRQLGDSIVSEFQVRLERQLADVEAALDQLTQRPMDAGEISRLMGLRSRLSALLNTPAAA